MVSFTNPLALGLLALLPLLLLAHFHGVRRRELRIPTARLFSARDASIAEPVPAWRHLRPSLLLWLQLLAATLAVLALAGPRFEREATGYANEVIVIDTSTSMAARSDPAGNSTRFDAAREAALSAIDALDAGQSALLLSTDPRVHQPYTDDARRLRDALARIPAPAAGQAGTHDVEDALRLARSLADGRPTRVRVFGDTPPSAATDDDWTHEWVRSGTPAANAALTAFALTPDAREPQRYSLFVRAGNFDTIIRKVELEIGFAGTVWLREAFSLRAGVERALTLPFVHEQAGTLTARIRYADNEARDALGADDSVSINLPEPRTRSVALVTEGNLFLEAGLAADESNRVSVRRSGASDATSDAIVLDGNAPATLGRGNYLLIGTLPDNAPIEVTGRVELPAVRDWDRDHPVTRHVALDGLLVGSALAVRETSGGGDVLVESARTPLVYAWEADGVRAVFVGFDVNASDLRVRPEFPLLLGNALRWLHPVSVDARTASEALPGANESRLALAPAAEPERSTTDARYERASLLWPTLLIAAIVVLLVEAWLYSRKRSAQRPALVPRAAAVSLLALALIEPGWQRADAGVHVLQLRDATPSVAAADTPQPDDSADGLTFADEGSDIGTGLRRALAALPGRGDQRLVVSTDGRDHGGTALSAAREADALGVRVYTVAAGDTPPGEVRLGGLRGPSQARAGEPVRLRLRAHAARATDARLTLSHDGEAFARQRLSLPAGSSTLTFERRAGAAGHARFEAHIEADGDRFAENNVALDVVPVAPRPRVLVVDGKPDETRSLVAMLDAQDIDADVRGSDTLAEAIATLERYDAVVLSNVSSLALTNAGMRTLHDYVYARGGGLLMLGGDRSFGLGGYYQTPVERALPVDMVVRQKLDVPSTSIVLVLDRSGSMNRTDGNYNRLALAREAAQRAIELLSENAEVGVLAFDMRSSWVVPITRNSDKAAAIKAIGRLRAGGGGTQLMWGLEKAYKAIAQRDSVIRHVIILSDGEVYSSRFPELLGRMVDKNITVSAVTIGSRFGQPQMRDISRMGRGRFYYSTDASALPRIFTMETQLAAKAALVEEDFVPTVAQSGHEILDDLALGTMPPLAGYVATTPKRSAETLLLTQHDDPLLSVWRYGLGRAAVFTSEFKPRWGEALLDWDDAGAMLAQLVRWTLRTARVADADARVERDGTFAIDIVDDNGAPLDFAAGDVVVDAPSGERTSVVLEQTASGRYATHVRTGAPGVWRVIAQLDTSDGTKVLQSRVVTAYSPEYTAFGPDTAALEAIAEAGGGRLLDSVSDVFAEPSRPGTRHIDAWPWLVLAGLALFALDILARLLVERRAARALGA